MIESESRTKPRDTGRAIVFNEAMATSSGSARTAPKGKATPSRNADDRGRTLLTPTIQWILAAIAGLAIVGAIIYFGSDIGDGDAGDRGIAPGAVVTESPSPT